MASDQTPNDAGTPRGDAPVPPPAARPRRRHPAMVAIAALLVIVLLIAGGVAWLVGTASGTRTLFRLAQQMAPTRVQAEGVDGPLVGPLRIARLRVQTAGADVTLRDVALDWSAAALLHRSLDVRSLHIGDVTVRLHAQPKKTPAQLPASLDLPFRMNIGQGVIDHVDIAGDKGDLLQLDRIDLALAFDHRDYRLDLRQLGIRLPQAAAPLTGHAQGHLTLAATRPYAIDAALSLQAAGKAASRPVDSTGTLALGGSLQDLRTRMDVQVAQVVQAAQAAEAAQSAGAAQRTTEKKETKAVPPSARTGTASPPLRLQGDALLHPFSAAPLPLARAAIRLQALNLRAWQPTLPATRIDGHLTLDDKGRGRLQLDNAQPGTWDRKALPLRSLQADFVQHDLDLTLRNLVAQLGSAQQPAGTLRGDGRYGHGSFDVILHADALDARRLDARARATQLRGDARVRGDADGQDVTLALQDAAHAPAAGQPLRLDLQGRRTAAAIRIDKAQLRAGQTVVDLRADIGLQDRQAFDVRGSVTQFRLSDFGRFPGWPALDLNADFSARGARAPALRADVQYRIGDSHLNGQPLSGDGTVHVAGTVIEVPHLALKAGVNTLSAQGRLAGEQGRLGFTLDAPQLAQLGPWAEGALQISGKASGSLARAGIDLTWTGSHLRLPIGAKTSAPEGTATARSTTLTATAAATPTARPPAKPAAPPTPARAPATWTIEATDGRARIATDRSLPYGLRDIDAQATARGIVAGARRLASFAATAQAGTANTSQLHLDVTAAGLDASGAHADAVTLRADGTTAHHTLSAGWRAPDQNWSVQASGGLSGLGHAPEWKGTLDRIDGSGLVQARLKAPAPLAVNARALTLQSLALDTSLAQIDLALLQREGDRLATRGRIDHLQVGKVLAFAGPQPAVSTDLVLGAQWDLRLDDTLSGSAAIAREQGDVVVHGGQPVTLGLATLDARAEADHGRLRLRVRGAGTQLGRIDLDLGTALGSGAQRLQPAADGPLSGAATLDIPSLAWVAPLVSPTAITQGSLRGHADVAGTVNDPRLQGRIDGSGLRVYLTDSGVDLRQGTLQATFNDARLMLNSLRFPGGDGDVELAGPVDFGGRSPGMQLSLTARKFQLFNRSDRKLVVSGAGRIALLQKHLDVSGNFSVDSGFIDIGRLDMPQLSDDVVIVGRERKKGRGGTAASLDVRIGLPNGVTLKGRGLDALLKGELRLRNSAPEPLKAEGTLDVAKGTFSAYGRDLKIERGLVRFNGPLNNPGLDILAMRRGLQVEAGVSVGGTVLAPRITLVSEPTVSDAEKLSWLVLGHGLSDATQGDAGTLQAAAGALLQRGAAAGVGSQLASAFGLDTVSLGTSQDTLQERIVTLGKQVSARLYVSYQKGLQTANNAILLRYTLSPRLTVEAEAGAISVLSLFYNVSFD